MIQMLEIRTGSAIWEIDGTILRFRRLKNVGDAVVERRINQYKSLLLEERYRANQEELIGITEILGEVILLKIGSEAFYKQILSDVSLLLQQIYGGMEEFRKIYGF